MNPRSMAAAGRAVWWVKLRSSRRIRQGGAPADPAQPPLLRRGVECWSADAPEPIWLRMFAAVAVGIALMRVVTGAIGHLVWRDMRGKFGASITLSNTGMVLQLPAGRSLKHAPPSCRMTIPWSNVRCILGAGRTEIARAVFGLEPFDRGTVCVDGVALGIRSPRDAIAAGIGFATEDRKRDGLVLIRSVRDNVALPILKRLARLGVVRASKERAAAEDAVRNLQIRTPSVKQLAQHLSGGNQQKVVLAKWLATGAAPPLS